MKNVFVNFDNTLWSRGFLLTDIRNNFRSVSKNLTLQYEKQVFSSESHPASKLNIQWVIKISSSYIDMKEIKSKRKLSSIFAAKGYIYLQ